MCNIKGLRNKRGKENDSDFLEYGSEEYNQFFAWYEWRSFVLAIFENEDKMISYWISIH